MFALAQIMLMTSGWWYHSSDGPWSWWGVWQQARWWLYRGCWLKLLGVCTLCEWPLKELLNENANMGVQANYFVPKEAFSMGWNGGYGFKHPKKYKIQVPARKIHPFSTHWVAMVAV